MALRFQKRIKIAPGVRLNLSKSTFSVTTGVKGASINVGNDGQHLNLGLPGSGLSTRTRIGAMPGRKRTKADQPDQTEPGIGSTIIALAMIAGAIWGIWALLT